MVAPGNGCNAEAQVAQDVERPRDWRKFAAASLAVLAGCTLLALSGAPARMPLMNAAALLIGLSLTMVLRTVGRLVSSPAVADIALVALACAIPLTALMGPPADGVSRWLIVAGVTIQPSFVIVPLLVLALAARSTLSRLIAVGVGAAGLALQPDPGAAAMLVAGIGASLLSADRSKAALGAFAVAAAALGVALFRTTSLPPVPFVEGVIAQAFESGPVTAAVALVGLAALAAPVLVRPGGERPSVALAFAGLWGGAVLASLLGPYPTPVIGYGGSAVLGYILSVAMLHRRQAPIGSPGTSQRVSARKGDDGHRVSFA